MLIFEKYLPKQEFNQLATVFRVLNPDPSKGNHTMLHTLILNNHPHLLKQFSSGIHTMVTKAVLKLNNQESSHFFKSKAH